MREESGSPSPEKITKLKVYMWNDVTAGDLQRLEIARSTEDLRRALRELLNVSLLGEPRTSALLDLYYHVLRFCWDCGFNREQTSCVLSVVKATHAFCAGSPLGDAAECYSRLQELLLRHSVHRPPFSIGLFSPQQLLHMSDYFVNTYFRHFKLYKYVFTPQVTLDLSVIYDGISEMEDTRTSDKDSADVSIL
ncbi:cilia- and flagella-associated protein 119 isoform X1 [Ranitomeya imitator]|uniref:cilia- and flagella-associated protein 119 isoform X1 n=1 Tax=Ranitomeya imitator TaxID=111125 RepID=UPI0037E8F740